MKTATYFLSSLSIFLLLILADRLGALTHGVMAVAAGFTSVVLLIIGMSRIHIPNKDRIPGDW